MVQHAVKNATPEVTLFKWQCNVPWWCLGGGASSAEHAGAGVWHVESGCHWPPNSSASVAGSMQPLCHPPTKVTRSTQCHDLWLPKSTNPAEKCRWHREQESLAVSVLDARCSWACTPHLSH